MVNPSELRIGNFVFADDVSKIVGIHPETIYIDDLSDSELVKRLPYKPKQLDAIPLTEEWLLKFGFEKYPIPYDEESEKDFDYFRMELRPDEQIVCFPKGKEVYVSGRYDPEFYGAQAEIQFIHQLQNLYFALTGKELELKKEPVFPSDRSTKHMDG